MLKNGKSGVKVTFTSPSEDWTYSTKTMFSSAANVIDNLSRYVDKFAIDDSDPKDIHVVVPSKYMPTLFTVSQMLNLELARSGLIRFKDVFDDCDTNEDGAVSSSDDEFWNELLDLGENSTTSKDGELQDPHLRLIDNSDRKSSQETEEQDECGDAQFSDSELDWSELSEFDDAYCDFIYGEDRDADEDEEDYYEEDDPNCPYIVSKPRFSVPLSMLDVQKAAEEDEPENFNNSGLSERSSREADKEESGKLNIDNADDDLPASPQKHIHMNNEATDGLVPLYDESPESNERSENKNRIFGRIADSLLSHHRENNVKHEKRKTRSK